MKILKYAPIKCSKFFSLESSKKYSYLELNYTEGKGFKKTSNKWTITFLYNGDLVGAGTM